MAFNIPWPAATPKTTKKLAQRNPVFGIISQGYKSAQLRVLFLADYPHAKRFTRFEAECLKHRLAPTSAASLWVAWIAVQKSITELTSIERAADAKALNQLEIRANKHHVWFAKPLTREMLQDVMTISDSDPSMASLIAMSWTLGQRLSDMIRLHPTDVTPSHIPNTICICVRRFKTERTNQPYTLFANTSSTWYKQFCRDVSRAAKHKTFIYTNEDTQEEHNAVIHRATELLRHVDSDLESRSVRRGGLQDMAIRGTPSKVILKFSRHASLEMLDRYLNWGASSTHSAMAMLTAQQVAPRADLNRSH